MENHEINVEKADDCGTVLSDRQYGDMPSEIIEPIEMREEMTKVVKEICNLYTK
mgnify:CR=1 FL=1